MAHYVRIGPIKSNKSGVGSRGYQLFRRGKEVVTVFGSVQVKPGRKFFWAQRPHRRVYLCASLELARALRREFRKSRMAANYDKLPRGAPIRFTGATQRARLKETRRRVSKLPLNPQKDR